MNKKGVNNTTKTASNKLSSKLNGKNRAPERGKPQEEEKKPVKKGTGGNS